MNVYKDMRVGARYKVIKGNDTMHKSDRIIKDDAGIITCIQAGGFIVARDAEKAMQGVEVTLDQGYAWDLIGKLELEVESIMGLYEL